MTYLLAHKAQIAAKNELGESPLHLATRNNMSAAATELLTQQAQADAQDNNGNTPLHMAAYLGLIHPLDILLLHKASVQRKKYKWKNTIAFSRSQGAHCQFGISN